MHPHPTTSEIQVLAAPNVLLRADGLVAGFGGRGLLPALDWTVERRQFWAVIGRNGAGKTTLLRTMLGLLEPVAGRVRVHPGVRIGYVPQRADIDAGFPARVVDIVAGGTQQAWSFLRPWARPQDREAVREAMVATGVEGLAMQSFGSLSEGQKQRVLVARALVCRPDVLLLDEPTSAMDLMAERQVFDLLDTLRSRRDMALIVVSHHLSVISARATHGVYVDREDGVAEAGPLRDIAENPSLARRYGPQALDCCLSVGVDDTTSAEATAGHAHHHGPHDHGHAHHDGCDPGHPTALTTRGGDDAGGTPAHPRRGRDA